MFTFSCIYVFQHLCIVEYVKYETQSWTYNLQIVMKFHTVFGFESIYSVLKDCQVVPPQLTYKGGLGGVQGGPETPRTPKNS